MNSLGRRRNYSATAMFGLINAKRLVDPGCLLERERERERERDGQAYTFRARNIQKINFSHNIPSIIFELNDSKFKIRIHRALCISAVKTMRHGNMEDAEIQFIKNQIFRKFYGRAFQMSSEISLQTTIPLHGEKRGMSVLITSPCGFAMMKSGHFKRRETAEFWLGINGLGSKVSETGLKNDGIWSKVSGI
jgi:hypothetical protein